MKEIKKLEECVLRKKNCLVYGEEGCGKTYLLKSMKGCYVEYPQKREIVRKVIDYYGIELTKKANYATAEELYKIIKGLLKNTVILVDNFEKRKDIVNFLDRISKEGATLIIASRKKANLGFVDEYLEIKNLRKEDALKMCEEMVLADEKAKKMAVRISQGNPGKLKRIIKQWNASIENLEFNFLDEKEVVEFFMNIRPKMPKRINLLPAKYLVVLGFSALILKFYFWDSGDYRTGYLVASSGYLLLIAWRMSREK